MAFRFFKKAVGSRVETRPRGLIATREPSTFLKARHAFLSRRPQSEGAQASLARERH